MLKESSVGEQTGVKLVAVLFASLARMHIGRMYGPLISMARTLLSNECRILS